MKKTRKKIEIIRLEERVLFDAAAAAAVVEAAEQQQDLLDQQQQQQEQLQKQAEQQEQQQEQAQTPQENAEIAGAQNNANSDAQAESAHTADDGADADGAERSELGNAVDAMSNDDDVTADEDSDVSDAEALQESVDAAAAEHTDAAIEALINGDDAEDAEESEDAIAPAADDAEAETSALTVAQEDTDTLAEEAAGLAPDAENTVKETGHHELAIISNTVQDQDTLISQLAEGTDVLVLNDSADVLDQINDYLDQQDHDYDAIHILSHGGNGYFSLNDTRIDMQALADDPASFAAIGEHLTDNGDILLYGCNIASGEEGQAFASQLASLTGADVAASTSKIGLTGGWDLDYSTGLVDVTGFSAVGYDYNMAAYTIAIAKQGTYVDTATDTYSYNGSGQLTKNGEVVANVGRVDWVAGQAANGDTVSVDAKLTGRSFQVDQSIAGTWTMGSTNSLTLTAGETVVEESLSVTARSITVEGDLHASNGGSISLSADFLNIGNGSDSSIYMAGGSVTLSGSRSFSAQIDSIEASVNTNTLTISSPAALQTLDVQTLYVHDSSKSFSFNMNGLHVYAQQFHLHNVMTMDASTLSINADNRAGVPDNYTTWNFSCFVEGELNTESGTVEYLNGYSTTDDHMIDLAPGSQKNVILNEGSYHWGGQYINGHNSSRVSAKPGLSVTTFSGSAGDPNNASASLLLDKLTGSTSFSSTVSYTGRDTIENSTARGLDVTYNDGSSTIYKGYYYNLYLNGNLKNKWTRTVNAGEEVMVSNNLNTYDVSESIRDLDIKGKLTVYNIIDNPSGEIYYNVYQSGSWNFAAIGGAGGEESESSAAGWAPSKDPASAVSGNVYGRVTNSGSISFKSDSYHFFGQVHNYGSVVSEVNYGQGVDCAVVFDDFLSYIGSSVEVNFPIQFTQMLDSDAHFTNFGTMTYFTENFGFGANTPDLYLINAAGAEIHIACGNVSGDTNIYVFDYDSTEITRIHLTNSGLIAAEYSSVVVFKDFYEGTGETASYRVFKTEDRLHIDGVMYFELDHVIADGIYGSITNSGGILNLNTANQQYLGTITTSGTAAGDASAEKFGITNINAKSIIRGTVSGREYSKINVGTDAAETDYRSALQPAVTHWYAVTPAVATAKNANETKFVGSVNSLEELNLNADNIVFEGALTASHFVTVSGNYTEFKGAVQLNSTSREGGTLFSFGSDDVVGTAFASSVTVGANGSLVTSLLLNSTAKISGTLTNSGNVTVEHDGVVFNGITNNSTGEFNLNSANNTFNGVISNSGNFYLNGINPGISSFTNSGYLWINTAAAGGSRGSDGYLADRSAIKNIVNSGTVTIRGELDFSGTYSNSGTTNLQWGGVRFLDTLTNSGTFNVTRDKDALAAESTLYIFDKKIVNSGNFKVLSLTETDNFPVTFKQKFENRGTVVISTTGNRFDEIANSGTFNLMTGGNTFDNLIDNSSRFYLNKTNTFTAKSSIQNTGDFQINAANDLSGIAVVNQAGTLLVGGDDVVLGNVLNYAGATLQVKGARVSITSVTGEGTLSLKGVNTVIGTVNTSGTIDVFGSASITDTLNLFYGGSTPAEVIVENGGDLTLFKIMAPVEYSQSLFTIYGSGLLHADYDGSDPGFGDPMKVYSTVTLKNGATAAANIVYDFGKHTDFVTLSGEYWVIIDTDTTLTETESAAPRWFKIVNGATLTMITASANTAFWVTGGSSLVLNNTGVQSGEAWITEGGKRGSMFVENNATVTVNAPGKSFTTAVYNSGSITVSALGNTFANLNNSGTFTVGRGGFVTLTNLTEMSGGVSEYATEAGGTLTFALTSGSVITEGLYGNLTNAGTMNLDTALKYYGTVSNAGTASSQALLNINALSTFGGAVSRNSYGIVTVAPTAAGTVFQAAVNSSSKFVIGGATVFERGVTISGEFDANAKTVFNDTVRVNVSDSSLDNTVFNAAAEVAFNKDVTFTNSTSTKNWSLVANINTTSFFNGKVTLNAQTGATHRVQFYLNESAAGSSFSDIDLLGSGSEFNVYGAENLFNGAINNGGAFKLNSADNDFYGDITNSGHFYLNAVNALNGAFVNSGELSINQGSATGLRLDGYLLQRSTFKALTNSGTVTISGEVDFEGAYINSGTTNQNLGGVRFLDAITNSGKFNVTCREDAVAAESTRFVYTGTIENRGEFKLSSVPEKVLFSSPITNSGVFTADAAVIINRDIENRGEFNINADNSVVLGKVNNSGTLKVGSNVENVRFSGEVTINENGHLYLGGEDTELSSVKNYGTIHVTGGMDNNSSTPGNTISKLTMDSSVQTTVEISATGELTLVNVSDDYHGTVSASEYWIVTTISSGGTTVINQEKMTDAQIEAYKEGTFPPENTDTTTYKVERRTVYVDGTQPKILVANGGILHFDPSVSQTVYSYVEVSGDSDVLYDPNMTKFESINYTDWTVVSNSREISSYGKYRIVSGGSVTVSGDAAASLFRVVQGGSLTLKDNASNITSLENRGGSVNVNGGTYGIMLENQYGTMTVNSGSGTLRVLNSDGAELIVAGSGLQLDAANLGDMKISGSDNEIAGANGGTLVITGSGNTLELANLATMEINGSGNTVDLTLNSGAVAVNADSAIRGVNAGVIRVADNKSVTISGFSDTAAAVLAIGSGSTAVFADAQTLAGSFAAGTGSVVNGNLTANGAFNAGSKLTVNGNLTVNGTVAGSNADFKGDVTYSGSQSVISGNYYSALNGGSAVNNGTVNTYGRTELSSNNGTLNAYGNVTLDSNRGTLNVNGNSIAAAVDASSGKLAVNGNSVSLTGHNSGSVDVNGSAYFNMISDVNAEVNINGSAAVSSADAFSGRITNNGTINLYTAVTALNGSIDNNGTINANVSNAVDAIFDAVAVDGATVNLNAAADLDGKTIAQGATVGIGSSGVSLDSLTNNGMLVFRTGGYLLNDDFAGSGTVGVDSGVTLTLAGSEFAGKYQVDGTLALAAGSTRLSGSLINNGTISANDVIFSGSNSGYGIVNADSAIYEETAKHLFGGRYGMLTVNSDGLLDSSASVGSFLLNGSLATAKNAVLTLNGVLRGEGLMAGGEGTVIYNGIDQRLFGGIYHNLTILGSVAVIDKDLEITGDAVNGSGQPVTAGINTRILYSASRNQQVMAANYGILELKGSGTKLMENYGNFEINSFEINPGDYYGSFVEVASSGNGRWNLDAENIDIHVARISDVNALRTYYLDGTNFQGTNNSANWLVFYAGSNVGETAPSMENANFNALSQYFYQERLQQMNSHELFSRHEQMESARNIMVRDMAVGSDISLNAKYDMIDFGNDGWSGLSLAEDEAGEILKSADAVSDSFDDALAEMLK